MKILINKKIYILSLSLSLLTFFICQFFIYQLPKKRHLIGQMEVMKISTKNESNERRCDLGLTIPGKNLQLNQLPSKIISIISLRQESWTINLKKHPLQWQKFNSKLIFKDLFHECQWFTWPVLIKLSPQKLGKWWWNKL